jgi:hypothetical protein
VEGQGKIVTHPGNMVLGRGIAQERIGAGTVRTLHILKFDDRHPGARRRFEGRRIMHCGGLRTGKMSPGGDDAEQEQGRYAEPGSGAIRVSVWSYRRRR